jgi:hypothetical protein
MTSGCIELTLYRTAEEIETLVRDFELCTLPREVWTHRAHLTVALWYLLAHPWDEAIRLTREGIKRYNDAHGIVTTPTGGYHETMTLFWLRIVRHYLETALHEDRTLVVLANNLLLRHGRKELPLDYYTRELLMSPEARASWVEPDLKSFTSR